MSYIFFLGHNQNDLASSHFSSKAVTITDFMQIYDLYKYAF